MRRQWAEKHGLPRRTEWHCVLRGHMGSAVGRELRMIELKREVNELCAELGRPRPYPLEFEKRNK